MDVRTVSHFVSDIAVFVLKRDVKLQLTHSQSVILRVFRCGHCKHLFVNEQNIIGLIFSSNCFKWPSLARKFASISSGSVQFLIMYILQGSVATPLRYGGTFSYCFARNLLLILSLKEF